MIDKRLLRECRSYKSYIPLSIISAIINAFFIVFSAYLLSETINAVFIKKYSLQAVEKYIIWFIANAGAKAAINFLMDTKIKNSSEQIKEGIRTGIFNKVISANPLKVKSERYGELINTLTEGIETVTPYFSQYIPQLFSSFIIPLIIGIAVFSIDRLSGLIMLITYPIIPVFMRLIGYKSKEVNERQWKKLSMLSSHFLEMHQGLSTLKAFGRSRLQEEKVYRVSEDYRKSTMEVLRVSFLSALVLELSATISTALIAVDLGLRLVYSKITFLNAFIILVLAPDFYLPLRQLGLKFHASLNGQVAIEKIEELQSFLEENTGETAANIGLDGEISIEVKNLSYSHDNKEAINNISFTINRGEKVALIGESGSGKSTLVNILCKLLEAPEGTVYINGRDINYINREEYLRKIAIVPQSPHIFNKSIVENITLGEEKYSESLLKAARDARVFEFTEEYADKLNTIIGDGEETAVSGGEKQRIAIARAIYIEADFIVLDEPTSAMDSETEELLGKVMEDCFRDKTVLLSAHRLNTVRNADKLLVMKDGKLIESGSPGELMLSKGYYCSLVKTEEERV
jgi:ATP-binding cassette subfamily C protein CydD